MLFRSGLEVARKIKKINSAAKILILTMHDSESYLREFLKLGISAYITKKSVDSELINAIRAVNRGDMLIDPSLTKAIALESNNTGKNKLSRREEEVLRLLVKGHLSKEMATHLKISVKTIETYRVRIYEKLGMSGRPELLQYAIKNGFFNPDID